MTVFEHIQSLLGGAVARLPDPLLHAICGGEHKVNGHALDARLQLGLRLAASQVAMEHGTPEEARHMSGTDAFNIERIELPRVEDFSAPVDSGSDGPAVPLRLYAPVSRSGTSPAGLPALVYCHGGGFVIGSLDSNDRFLRLLCRESGLIVVAVGYRLAPEHKFPSALEDCLLGYRSVCRRARELGIDPQRIGVGGDSAGGNLAVNLCLAAREGRVPRPLFQALIYPWLDASRETESHERYARGYGLTRELIAWFIRHSMPTPESVSDPLASPLLREPDAFDDLPPACTFLSGFDPLRDEGRRYHDLLRERGVPSELRTYDSLTHGILNLGGLVPAARSMTEDYARAAKALAYAGSD